MEFPLFDLSSPPTVPPRIRRRLTQTNPSTSPSTLEQIQAKLRNADLRRQKFYENLTSKARPKLRAPQPANDHNLAQRLQAKLQAAQQNRMQILNVHSQRRATLRERTCQSLQRTIALKSKYREHVNGAICKKRLTAEKNRLGIQEADKNKGHNRILQGTKVAKSVPQQQEIERCESLEDKLQTAKRQRAEYLKQKVSLNSFAGVHLSRLLLRCWKKFLQKRTTLDLAKTYHELNINTTQGESTPFEHFAFLIETPSTLGTTKALLDRLETRCKVLTSFNDINHLLTRVVSSNKYSTKTLIKLSRYQPRVVLSAYMILGHPDAVFSGKSVRETALANSAKIFAQEFELLIDVILNGASKTCTFRSQVAAFDGAWCSYLNSFVVWKVKDVESLEKNLVNTACDMEISTMKKYKLIMPRGNDTHDVKAFQKQMQVTQHQKLLREKILHLSGKAGIERLEIALLETRRSFFESNAKKKSSHVESRESPSKTGKDELEDYLGMENVFIVNEFLHGKQYSFTNTLNISHENQKIRKTMEKAFWDGILDCIKEEKYDHVVALMKEVQDELCEMSPQSWKQEILQVIDLNILSQLLSSRSLDMEYLGKIMEFALVSLRKLSAIANEISLKESHRNILLELSDICQAGDGSNRSHAIALIKGLRFVLEQIQMLKQEISKARIKMMEPLLKGPTGLEYLRKAFEKVYGPPGDASIQLPLTKQWLSSVVPEIGEEWNEHNRMLLEGSATERLLPSTAFRTGGSFSSRLQTLPLVDITDNEYTEECKGEKGDLVVRLGLVKLVNNVHGVMQEELPETLKVNFHRLRGVQAQLQNLTVIATSILILRQTLVMEGMISSSEDMESTILKCSRDLSRILESSVDAGLDEVVQVLSKTMEGLDLTKTESRWIVMTRMLRKSVQAGDPVFVRVSRAVYLATRGVVVGGLSGRVLAEKVLRKVGAVVLVDKVVESGKVLRVMARVTQSVHGLWYANLIHNM